MHRRASSQQIRRPRNGARWLPVLLSPVLFGAVIKLFPLDVALATTAILGILGLYVLLGMLASPGARAAPMVATLAIFLCCLSLPFWSLRSGTAVPARPIFSYKEAKANPDAFVRWWRFFAAEVTRTQEVVYMPDPKGKLPHVPRPGATTDFIQGSIAINELGYRGDNFLREKGNSFRIVAIGSSQTFGQTISPDSRPWPAVLGDLIRQRLHCARPVQVINGGVNAYVVANATERLDRDMAWLAPDMVLSYFGWTDRRNMGVNPKWLPTAVQPPPEAPPSDADRVSIAVWLWHKAGHSLLANIKAIAARLGAVVEPFSRDTMIKEALEGELFRQYTRLIDQASQNGYPLVFLSINTAVQADSPEGAKSFYRAIFRDVDSAIDLMKIHNLMLHGFAQTYPGVYFADTSENLAGRFDEGLYLDVVHFTASGDVLMANNVYRGIEQMLIEHASLACRRR